MRDLDQTSASLSRLDADSYDIQSIYRDPSVASLSWSDWGKPLRAEFPPELYSEEAASMIMFYADKHPESLKQLESRGWREISCSFPDRRLWSADHDQGTAILLHVARPLQFFDSLARLGQRDPQLRTDLEQHQSYACLALVDRQFAEMSFQQVQSVRQMARGFAGQLTGMYDDHTSVMFRPTPPAMETLLNARFDPAELGTEFSIWMARPVTDDDLPDVRAQLRNRFAMWRKRAANGCGGRCRVQVRYSA